MSDIKERYIGESKLSEEPKKKLIFQIRDGCVTTSKLADRVVTADKIQEQSVGSYQLAGGGVSWDKLDSTVQGKILEGGSGGGGKVSVIDSLSDVGTLTGVEVGSLFFVKDTGQTYIVTSLVGGKVYSYSLYGENDEPITTKFINDLFN